MEKTLLDDIKSIWTLLYSHSYVTCDFFVCVHAAIPLSYMYLRWGMNNKSTLSFRNFLFFTILFYNKFLK